MKSSREQVMTMSENTGTIFDIKRFATHDGAGIRTTLFLKGCPLRCVWCQNPEGLHPHPQVLYMETKCLHCGSCVAAANVGGVRLQDQKLIVNRACKDDWVAIVDACPTRALQFAAQSYRVEEAFEELMKDEAFFQHGGGITISGGEPFLQYDFLKALLQRCHHANIHTAIESSLYTKQENLRNVMPFLDQIYADLKLFDSGLHKDYTGIDNVQIKDNIRMLLESEKRDCVIIRTPLIPGMSAIKENIQAIASFLSSIYPDVKYELLNYNPLAKAKYHYLDMEYCFQDNPSLYTDAQMETFYQIARDAGIRQLIRE